MNDLHAWKEALGKHGIECDGDLLADPSPRLFVYIVDDYHWDLNLARIDCYGNQQIDTWLPGRDYIRVKANSCRTSSPLTVGGGL